MASIIASEELEKHTVDKYNFKMFSNLDDDEESCKESSSQPMFQEKPKVESVDSSALSTDSKSSLIESLMQKTDEMSSNFIKLQMKLEDKEEEYKRDLSKAKEEFFAEGVESGKKELLELQEKNQKDSLSQFSSSVATLELTAKDFETALESIKSELLIASLDIAKEVINIELNSSSKEVAKVLSDSLIKDLQSASKITLKVNPNDHGTISQHVGSMEHIEVVSDSAISIGGVVAISDAGNIDAQVSKRFDRVKRVVLSD